MPLSQYAFKLVTLKCMINQLESGGVCMIQDFPSRSEDPDLVTLQVLAILKV
jgi:hypothetical protein